MLAREEQAPMARFQPGFQQGKHHAPRRQQSHSPLMLMMLPKMMPKMDPQNPMSALLQNAIKARMANEANEANQEDANPDYDYDYVYDYGDYDYDESDDDEDESAPSLIASILKQMASLRGLKDEPDEPHVEISSKLPSPESAFYSSMESDESEEIEPTEVTQQEVQQLTRRPHGKQGQQQPTEQVSYRNAP
jgi:hypothetical protein